MTIIVAGSGPAGLFAALGALEAGAKVIMVDPGLKLEPEAELFKKQLAVKDWRSWTQTEINRLKSLSTRKRNRRYAFGSDFATRSTADHGTLQKGCSLFESAALGGLSNVWGRGVEPPYKGEIDHWPFKDSFLYSMRHVLAQLPFSAAHDNLAEVMPLLHDHPQHPSLSPEAEQQLAHWQKNTGTLNAAGMHFGRLRAAVRQSPPQEDGCWYCRMCYYGCVYGALFDSSQLLPLLHSYSGFEYRPGVELQSFESTAAGVRVVLRDIKSEQVLAHDVGKLIVAAGSSRTTRIVMQSLGVHEARLKNSELITLPLLSFIALPKKTGEHHALGQLTLTLAGGNLTRRAVVVHLFNRNPAIDDLLLARLPAFLRPAMAALLAPLLRRLFIGMCFLHSDDSSSIDVSHADGRFIFTGQPRRDRRRIYARLLFLLAKQVRTLGLLPLPFIGGIAKPGSSVHYGSSLPIGGGGVMACDVDGALKNHPSVYIADAASLPDIPAGSYTLSIMANAHRIGQCAAKPA